MREAKGLTQTELAGLVGVALSAVSAWESNNSPRQPTAENVIRLCAALDTSTDFLLLGKEPAGIQSVVDGIESLLAAARSAQQGSASALNKIAALVPERRRGVVVAGDDDEAGKASA